MFFWVVMKSIDFPSNNI